MKKWGLEWSGQNVDIRCPLSNDKVESCHFGQTCYCFVMTEGIGLRTDGHLEELPQRFDWRDYLKNPESMSKASADILDELSVMVNNPDPEGANFRSAVAKGQYKGHVLHGLLQYYRSVMTPEEKQMAWDEIEKCGQSLYLGPKDMR